MTLLSYHEAYQGEFQRIEAHLQTLLANTGVGYALLIDRRGFILAHAEQSEQLSAEAMESIGTLLANNAASTEELTNVLGRGAFTEQLFQGEHGTLYMHSVGAEHLLVLVYDGDIPSGQVQVYTKKSVRSLQEMMLEIKALPRPTLSDEFVDGAEDLLDDLLGLDE